MLERRITTPRNKTWYSPTRGNFFIFLYYQTYYVKEYNCNKIYLEIKTFYLTFSCCSKRSIQHQKKKIKVMYMDKSPVYSLTNPGHKFWRQKTKIKQFARFSQKCTIWSKIQCHTLISNVISFPKMYIGLLLWLTLFLPFSSQGTACIQKNHWKLHPCSLP